MFWTLFITKDKLTFKMKRPQMPITNNILNTAEPTIDPIPASLLLTNTPTSDMNTSGADEPAAMNVAPATSWSNCKRSDMHSSDGKKYSSQTRINATHKYPTNSI